MRKIQISLAFFLTVMLAACSSVSEKSVSIPTPSAKAAKYVGQTVKLTDVAASLYSTGHGWVEQTSRDKNITSFSEPSGCVLDVYPSFQDAVNHDLGIYGESWTYSGKFGQFGLLLIGSLDTCTPIMPSDFLFSERVDVYQNQNDVLIANKANIIDCLTIHAECFDQADLKIPTINFSSVPGQLTEILLLDENGYCKYHIEYPDSPVTGCQLAEGLSTTASDYLILGETREDFSILRISASTSVDEGKYLIYGDGWMINLVGSTERDKQLFLDMNKIVKGTLVARY